ncbi:MAG TPA: sugar phosphate isomerase/epimerase family protein [Allosphingosinicella sp.]|nr:sugar phosphate isomerase/epimerase family protein [Allosphingosinicella sp.]
MRIAQEAGFEGIELEVGDGPAAALRQAADAAGIIIHSVHCWENYRKPLTSPEPAVRDAGIAATLAALEAAHVMGAGAMLLIPGVVGADASYDEVDRRSRDVIVRAILPEAERLGIVLVVENVWNGFLLSPCDCARYIESFASPGVRLCLDLGNVIFGRPEGWLDIAGRCAASLHLKDLRHWLHLRRYQIVRVGEGDIDWPAVRAALTRIGFSGWGVMAEAESAQPNWSKRAFSWTRRLSARLGWNPPLAAAERRLSRHYVDDAMRRFRRYVVPSPAGSN